MLSFSLPNIPYCKLIIRNVLILNFWLKSFLNNHNFLKLHEKHLVVENIVCLRL